MDLVTEAVGARAAIIDAAARLLQEHGTRALTTRGVAQAAGVQPPAIYRLFGDKDGLIDAVAEHVMATYVAAKRAEAATRSGDGDPVADLRAGWEMHVEFGLANPELYELLNAPGRREHSPATAAGIEVLRARVHRLALAGLLRVDEGRAVMMIHAAGSGAVLALLRASPEERDLGLPAALFEAVADRILATPQTSVASTAGTAAVTLKAALPDLTQLTAAERSLMAEWLTRTIA